MAYKRRHIQETLDEELLPGTYNRFRETTTPVRSRCTESSVTLQNFGVHRLSDFSPRERAMYRKMKQMEHSRKIVDARRKRINIKKGASSKVSISSSGFNTIIILCSVSRQ